MPIWSVNRWASSHLLEVAAVGALALAGCKSERVAMMQDLVEKACKCPDSRCVEILSGDVEKVIRGDDSGSADESQKLNALFIEWNHCRNRFGSNDR